MRFLVDECTGPGVARWLRSQSHDVVSIYDEARGLGDDAVLNKAVSEQRILITNDKDFGEMVFRERRTHCGVILLRLPDERPTSKIESLRALLARYAEHLENAFIVVTETQIRVAAPAPRHP